MRPLFYTLLLAGLMAPGAASAAPERQRLLTALKVECVAGAVIVRSITSMIQLRDPTTGKPMSCMDLAFRTKRQEELNKLNTMIDKQNELIRQQLGD